MINKNNIKYMIIAILFVIIIYLFYIHDIRLCPVYNIFKVPCPGCGLTRAYVSLIHLDIKKSISYNILAIPLVIGAIFSVAYYVKDKEKYKEFMGKHKKIIITLAIFLTIFTEILNFHNPDLY